MNKLLGILVFLGLLYGCLLLSGDAAQSYQNHRNVAERIGLYGILTLAAAFVIVTGNIDLSVGSVIAFTATLLALMLTSPVWTIPLTPWHRLAIPMEDPGTRLVAAVPIILLAGALVGLINGLLVTYLRVQAFVVTLCGMFIYRDLARWLAGDRVIGLGSSYPDVKSYFMPEGDVFGVPMHFLILVGLLIVAGVFLHVTVFGRYFYAIGSNERAARFAGVPVNLYKVMAFVICSTLTAFYSIIWLFTYNSVQPSTAGSMRELYAIAGVVLGGFSLRGGEGTVFGILIGASIIQILPNMTNMWGVPNTLEGVVIGLALLLGATVDELLRRRRATQKA